MSSTYEISFVDPEKELDVSVCVECATDAAARTEGVKKAREWTGETRRVWSVRKVTDQPRRERPAMGVSIYLQRQGREVGESINGLAGNKQLFCALKDLPFIDDPANADDSVLVVRPTDFTAWRERVALHGHNVDTFNALLGELECDASLWLVFSY